MLLMILRTVRNTVRKLRNFPLTHSLRIYLENFRQNDRGLYKSNHTVNRFHEFFPSLNFPFSTMSLPTKYIPPLSSILMMSVSTVYVLLLYKNLVINFEEERLKIPKLEKCILKKSSLKSVSIF